MNQSDREPTGCPRSVLQVSPPTAYGCGSQVPATSSGDTMRGLEGEQTASNAACVRVGTGAPGT